ncbi:MAG: energy transducer TonB [Polyangiaceae bacterium]|nr:energy transducer TonB [Polyangiaceae bacterium]
MTAAARKLEPDPEPPSLRAVEAGAGSAVPGARPNPLGPVLALGRHQVRVGIAVGLAGALFVHGAAAGKGLSTLVQLARFSAIVERAVAERLRASYDVDFTPPPEAEVPEPEPEPPPPEKTPQPVAAPTEPAEQRKSDNPYDEPPPAAAEAGRVLTAEPDPSEPVDMTDQGFISGSGDRFAGGTTAADGTAKSAVRSTTAKGGVAPGGTGTGKPSSAPPPPAQDLSKAPTLLGGGSWNDCGFPAEAEMDQVDFGIVTLTVTVGSDGKAQSVAILSDPGHGFGRHARGCAMRKRFNPGLDKAGNPTTRTTPPIRVRFTR